MAKTPLTGANGGLFDGVTGSIQQLQQQMNELSRKTLYSAVIGRGGIKIDGTGGIQVSNGHGAQFYVGGGFTAPAHSDGSPQIITLVGDETGQDRLVLYDENTPGSVSNQRWHEWDQGGRLVRSQDTAGGWATPWFSVPMYAYIAMGAGAFQYMNVQSASFLSGTVLSEGRIPFVSHPKIAVDGIWGIASGAGNATYSLNVNGSSVGTWTAISGAGVGASSQGPWDISALLTQKQVSVTISVTYTAACTIALNLFNCYLRQT